MALTNAEKQLRFRERRKAEDMINEFRLLLLKFVLDANVVQLEFVRNAFENFNEEK